MNDDIIRVRIVCRHARCGANKTWEGDIKKYQVGLLAIWFHSSHEGHKFDWYEDGELVLGEGDVRES